MTIRRFNTVCTVLFAVAACALIVAVQGFIVGNPGLQFGGILAALTFAWGGKLFVRWHELYGKRE